jgi:hypothetical protein
MEIVNKIDLLIKDILESHHDLSAEAIKAMQIGRLCGFLEGTHASMADHERVIEQWRSALCKQAPSIEKGESENGDRETVL